MVFPVRLQGKRWWRATELPRYTDGGQAVRALARCANKLLFRARLNGRIRRLNARCPAVVAENRTRRLPGTGYATPRMRVPGRSGSVRAAADRVLRAP